METLRRTIAWLIFAAAIALLVVLVVLTVSRNDLRPRTDDAFLSADIVHLAPEVSGKIVSLNVRNNQFVHAGDVLFVIDPQPYQLHVEQARANVAQLEASLAVSSSQVQSQVSSARAADASILSAKAQLAYANDTLARLTPLGNKGYVSRQEVEQARTSARTAQVTLVQSRAESDRAREAVRSTAPLLAELDGARASLALAERDLRLTTVHAPCNGWVTALYTTRGEYASTGSPIFTLIDTDRWYATGNVRETDLGRLRIGQAATVFVLASPGQALSGHIESFGRGVSPDEGTGSNGLPEVSRSLDWVRIAQRFPVRVLLDAPPPDLMRIGATVSMVIDR